MADRDTRHTEPTTTNPIVEATTVAATNGTPLGVTFHQTGHFASGHATVTFTYTDGTVAHCVRGVDLFNIEGGLWIDLGRDVALAPDTVDNLVAWVSAHMW